MLMLMLVQVETKGREGERARSIVEYDDDDNKVDDIGDDYDDNDDDNVGVGPREGERGGQGRAWNIRAATSSTALVDSAAKEFVKNFSHYDRCAKVAHQNVFKLLSKKIVDCRFDLAVRRVCR